MSGPVAAGRALWRPHRTGIPFFAVASGSRRERSGTDVVQLVTAAVASAAVAAVAVPTSGFERALVGLIDEVPDALDLVWQVGVCSLAVWVLAVLVAAAARRRGEVLVDALATAAVSVAAAVLVAHRLQGTWPTWSQAVSGRTAVSTPVAALSLAAGAALAASPHLSGPFRRLGRWCVVTGAVSAALLGAATPTGALLSLLLAGAASAAVHLVLGSRAGNPTVAEVGRALEDLDVEARDLAVVGRRPGGVLVVDGTVDGDPVVVTVHGRDARDSQLLSRLWRWLWYRDAPPMTWTRHQQVEHEGFVTLLAGARGVPVPEVVTAGATGSHDALLVVRGAATPLARVDPDELDAARLGEVWDALAALHAADLAHGALDPEAFALLDGRVVLWDLSTATTAPSEDLCRIDRAHTLVTTALLVGVERAVVAAADHLGDDGVEEMLPYLQAPSMDHRLRRGVRAAPFDLDALRAAAAGVVGVEEPEIRQLRRMSPRTLVTAALIALVAVALISALADVDPQEIADLLASADPAWLAVALAVAQLPFLSQAVATRGACPRPLPYGPMVMLQVGVAFVALAVPTTAGRLALDIRFFQRQGVPATAALSISAIDGFAGFLVQVAVLVATLVLGLGAVDLSLDPQPDPALANLVRLLAVAAACIVLAAVVALAFPSVRHRLVDRVRPALSGIAATVQGLRSPSHLLQLFGGNLANQLLFGLALGASLAAFGGSLDVATLVVVYVIAALFGGFMPVPGGIGAVEAALIAGLVAAGIDTGTATATALTFRFATFYLPPLWGWIAMRWLQRHAYL